MFWRDITSWKKYSKVIKVYKYDWYDKDHPQKVNLYCIECSKFTNDSDIKIKYEIDERNNIFSYYIN